jgi:hypothetical protein
MLPVDVDPALGFFRRVDVGSFADVSKVHAASIFIVQVNKIINCSCIHRL